MYKKVTVKAIIILCIIFSMLFSMIGCAEEESIGGASFKSIDSSASDSIKRHGLTYDTDTNVVYIINYTSGTAYVLTPYYSENGKLCRYIDGEIVEINN